MVPNKRDFVYFENFKIFRLWMLIFTQRRRADVAILTQQIATYDRETFGENSDDRL